MANVLTFWNMPPFAASFITRESDGYPCHHCAFQEGNWVYDAAPPVVRKTSLQDYTRLVRKWQRNWRYWFKEPLRIETYQVETVPSMRKIAEHWLGREYDLRTYYKDHDFKTHCSKYLSMILHEKVRFKRKHHRVRPIDIHKALS